MTAPYPSPSPDDVLLYAAHPDGSGYSVLVERGAVYVVRVASGATPQRAGPFPSVGAAVTQVGAIMVDAADDVPAIDPDQLTSPRVVARPHGDGVAALHRLRGEGWVELFSDDDGIENGDPIHHASMAAYFTALIASLDTST